MRGYINILSFLNGEIELLMLCLLGLSTILFFHSDNVSKSQCPHSASQSHWVIVMDILPFLCLFDFTKFRDFHISRTYAANFCHIHKPHILTDYGGFHFMIFIFTMVLFHFPCHYGILDVWYTGIILPRDFTGAGFSLEFEAPAIGLLAIRQYAGARLKWFSHLRIA